jgi:hypothetical protein
MGDFLYLRVMNKFYIYLHIRKTDNIIFYVGKGIGDRYLTHLRVANGSRKGKNNLIISKIRSILNDGYEPIIIKIVENLTKENYDGYEKSTIKEIGKSCDNLGPLLNIMDGGEGGITWIGENPFKGKTLEELYGLEKSREMKKTLSESASKRTRELNPMFGKRGADCPHFGKTHSDLRKQNQSVGRNITNTFLEDTRNMVLSQYFMLTFSYNLKNFGAAKKTETKEEFLPKVGYPGSY